MADRTRPTKPEYFMRLAMEVRSRANCTGRKVGAVLIKDDRIISTGYNGTPGTMTNCGDGGCYRCAHPEDFAAGQGYDVCICVHAEQNALLAAARFGIAVEGCALYSTLQPCFGCLKEALQARVARVVYLRPWAAAPELSDQYAQLVAALGPGNFEEFPMPDPDEEWALRGSRPVARTTGHVSPSA
jgi:dCMP deaminase